MGLQNAKLSEKLQLDPALTLEKAVNEARQSEAVKKQQAVVRGSGPSGEDDKQKVDAVLQKRRPMHEKPEPANTKKRQEMWMVWKKPGSSTLTVLSKRRYLSQMWEERTLQERMQKL